MANPTGTLNADEDHSTRKITNLAHPPVADHDAATKKYVDDNIVSGSTSDSAFGATWNGVTTVAPSKNAVYDWAHTLDTDDDGKVNVLDSVAGLVKTDAGGVVSNAVAKSDYWDTSNFTPSGTGHAHGLVPDPGASAGATRFLREDATWVAPAGTGTVTTTGAPVSGNLAKFSSGTSITNADLTGDVTTSGGVATTIATNAVTLAKMATMATDSILGRATTGTGNVETLSALPFAYTGDVTRPVDSNITTLANIPATTTIAGVAGTRGDVLYYGASGWAKLTAGTSGNQLTTNGAGADPTWAAPGSGGTPGGSTTQVQFNDAGAFAGDAGLTWDKTGKALTVTGNQNAVTDILTSNPNTGSNAQAVYIAKNSTNQAGVGMLSTSYSSLGVIGPDTGYFSTNGTGGMYLQTSANAPIKFATNGNTEIARFTNTGILTLGSSQDTGLARNAAGVFEINSGTAGAYRDVKLRTLLLNPGAAPTGVEGALYGNSTDHKIYYHNGTSFVDLTAGGAGGTIASTTDILKGDGSGNAVALGSATSGKVLKSNGTTFVASTETYAAPGTSGNVLTSDGTNWTSAAPAGGGGGTTVKVAGSNFTTSATTLTNITGLSFAAAVNTLYEVDALLKVQASDTNTMKFSVACSAAGATGYYELLDDSSSVNANALGFASANTILAANSDRMAWFKAIVTTVGATGNITIQVAKNTAGSATIYVGSRMTVTAL